MSESHERCRQACEPCRRRKTKCPAERPACSLCQRLDRQCVYLPREQSKAEATSTAGGVRKTRVTRDRFLKLESQINGIYHMLDSFSTTNKEPSSGPSENRDISSVIHPDMQGSRRASRCPFFGLTCSELPAEALNHLVEVYRTTLHLQPLPLFSIEGLQARLTSAPQYLLWSFLALTLTFSNHDFYRGRNSDAVEFYARSAEDAAMRLAADGIARLEVIQSLCLLALKHVKARKAGQARMIIGISSRLETFRKSTQYDSEEYRTDVSSRCYWSVFILEKLFAPHLSDLPDTMQAPNYPLSAPSPPYISCERSDSYRSNLFNSEERTEDFGINAYYIQLISVWGKIAFHLHEIRLGKIETPWFPDSTHTRLNAKLLECDAQLPHTHLLRNTLFSKRSCAQIFEQLEYWNPWISMQFLSHASMAILNHPFVHLFALRSDRGVLQSRLFLQQTVDQALFHSAWVFRLIEICEELGFEAKNPLVGHLVGATASISWLFQFAKDHEVANKANEDLCKCERLLGRISTMWPYISQKLEIIQDLQSVANDRLQETAGRSTTITFQPSMFWKLLDLKDCELMRTSPTTDGMITSRAEPEPDAMMSLSTHFVHSLVEDQAEHLVPPNRIADTAAPILRNAEDLERMSIDEFFDHFALDGFNWLES